MEEKKDLQVVIQEVEAHYEDSRGTEERSLPQGKHNSKDKRNTLFLFDTTTEILPK